MTPAELKEARKGLFLSQTKLATILGIGIATVQRWEQGTWPAPLWLPLAMASLKRMRRSERERMAEVKMQNRS